MRVVYARATAPVTMGNGAQGMVQKGSHWPADDPVVRQYPDLFSNDARFGMNYSVEPDGYDAPIDESPVVETATAAPGEKRNTRRTA